MENMDDNIRLHKLSWQIFDKMQKICHDNQFAWGFHFAYSPQSAWQTDTKILILTLNPQLRDKNRQPKAHWPDKPWPEAEDHDFFKAGNDFPIKKKLQWLHQILALRDRKNFPVLAEKGPEYGNWLDSDPKLKEFACNNVAMASFVPFRTACEKDIAPWMWEFATTQYWPQLLEIWRPDLIVVIGNASFLGTTKKRKKFPGLNSILSDLHMPDGKIQEYKVSEFFPPTVACKGKLKYRSHKFRTVDKHVTLIGLPHPSGSFGTTGWPKANCDSTAIPIYKFLNRVFEDCVF